MALFINNLPIRVTHTEIQQLFEEFGSVVYIFIPTNWYSDQPLGFVFVEMLTPTQEQIALQMLDNSPWIESKLSITKINTAESIHRELV